MEDSKRENQILARLPEAERQRIAAYLEPVTLEHRQVLLRKGEPIEAVWFLDDAVTSTVVDTPEGTTIEVGMMGAEGFVGLSLVLGTEVSNTTVVVQMSGRAHRMRAEDFRRHVSAPGGPLYTLLLRYSNAFMGAVAAGSACNSLHPVGERVCRWLLTTQDRVRADHFPLTQEYLSLMLGVRRPGVSEVAGSLKRDGLIDYTRGSITVLDREGLLDRSCECYEEIKALSESHLR